MQISSRALLLPLLLLAGFLRFHQIGFGLPAVNDPDELMFELGALRMLRTGTLNPGWFGHPATTTMYGLALANMAAFGVGRLLGWYQSQREFADAVFANPTLIVLPGRLLMGAFGVLCVGLTAKLGTMLWDRTTGLVAALILAVSPVAVHWAQIIRSDIMASAFMLLCLIATLRYRRGGRTRDLVIAGLWLGIAIVTKWPFAIAGSAMLAVLAASVRERAGASGHVLGRAALFWTIVVAAVIATSPYLVLANDVVIRNLMGEAQQQHLGATGGSIGFNAMWYMEGPFLSAFGWLGIVFVLGGLIAAMRLQEARLVLLPVMALFFVVLVSQKIVWERWVLPLLPFAAMAAAAGIVRAANWLATRLGRSGSLKASLAATAALSAMVTVPLTAHSLAEARARANDTRQIAAQWAATHIPPGATVLIEHFGFDLYDKPWRILFPLGKAGCVDARAMLAGKIDYARIERARGGHSNVDYGTVDPAMVESCRADYAILTQANRYFAEQSRFPKETAAYKQLIHSGRVVERILPVRNRSDGPVITIVRFAK